MTQAKKNRGVKVKLVGVKLFINGEPNKSFQSERGVMFPNLRAQKLLVNRTFKDLEIRHQYKHVLTKEIG